MPFSQFSSRNNQYVYAHTVYFILKVSDFQLQKFLEMADAFLKAAEDGDTKANIHRIRSVSIGILNIGAAPVLTFLSGSFFTGAQ